MDLKTIEISMCLVLDSGTSRDEVLRSLVLLYLAPQLWYKFYAVRNACEEITKEQWETMLPDNQIPRANPLLILRLE